MNTTKSKKSLAAQKAYLFIQDNAERKYVLDYAASDSQEGMKEHLERLVNYKTQLQAEEAWLIHIGIARPTEKYQYQFHPDVDSVYIWHDPDFNKATAWIYKNGKLYQGDIDLINKP